MSTARVAITCLTALILSACATQSSGPDVRAMREPLGCSLNEPQDGAHAALRFAASRVWMTRA